MLTDLASRPASVDAERSPASLGGLARHLTAVGIAGVLAGLVVGGLGGRVFMRLAAIAAPDATHGRLTEGGNVVGEITLAGSLSLVIFVGLASGIAGAALYAVFQPWVGWAGRARGALFGVLLFAIGSATSDVLNPDNRDFTILDSGLLTVAMIALLFVGYGILADALYRWLDGALPPPSGPRRRVVVYSGVALLGVLLVLPLLPSMLFTGEGCDCDPPLLATGFVVVAAVGTVLLWASSIWSAAAGARPVARVLGFAGLAGALGFGLLRALSDAADVIG
jgi:hypothetical protein